MPLVTAQTLSRAANDPEQAVNLRANMIRSFALNLKVCKMNQKQITQEETLQTQGSWSVCVCISTIQILTLLCGMVFHAEQSNPYSNGKENIRMNTRIREYQQSKIALIWPQINGGIKETNVPHEHRKQSI